ncbi:hypothetical protein [Saccharicrinis fermentans]|uniref:Phage abortive infection protein n=1 Tax=Saccharicrinis fermentans DSM 9555 = JCM 21142 TaxID=869213 RepID=W7YU11_9BACT|nr:hypothetical protein [Saccharicrinis fermentans]GAF05934.1 hypothetical protein JCM21142_124699 [Saccharicrinis fermentans DSM 9555 = JCM 21142]
MKNIYKREYTGFILIALGIMLSFYFLIEGNFLIWDGVLDPEQLARFGGLIGGTIGVIFSLAAYILIYETFRLQKKQQFESMFFSLFNEFNNFRYNYFSIDHSCEKIAPGIKAFTYFIEGTDCLGLKTSKHTISEKDFKNIAIKFKSQLNKFCSHLDMILYLLNKQSELNNTEKKYYLKYILSQLTEHERFLLYYRNKIEGIEYNNIDSLEIKDPEKVIPDK